MNDRVTLDKTNFKNMIENVNKGIITKEQLIENIIGWGIYQIKFSGWTRGSTIIEELMKLFPNSGTHGGKKYSKKKDKKKFKKSRSKKNK